MAVEFTNVEAVAETSKALCCKMQGQPKDLWFPKGQITDESEVFKKGDKGTLIVTDWIAQEKGLV